MKTEEEIRKQLELARERAYMYYERGDFLQHGEWCDFMDALEWVLEEE